MKAILTKYLGPTNFKGSRIKASEPDGKSVTLSWNHALDAPVNHFIAAKALQDKMQWKGELIQGWLKEGYVHVFK